MLPQPHVKTPSPDVTAPLRAPLADINRIAKHLQAHPFQMLTPDGERFASELFLNRLDYRSPAKLRLIVQPRARLPYSARSPLEHR